MNKKNKSKRKIAEHTILKILPTDETNSQSSIQITNKLKINIHRSYVSFILNEMATNGLINSKKKLYGNGYLYWNKESTKNKYKKYEYNILTILSNLRTDETINVANIVKRMKDFEIHTDNKSSISTVLSKLYYNNEVKRTDNLYIDGYWYWLEGNEKEKIIKGRKIVPKSNQIHPVVPHVKTPTINSLENTLKQINELHTINIALRNRIGNYEVIMDEQAELLRSKDKEIDKKQNTINELKIESKHILIAQAEKTVQKDVKESQILLEKVFRD